MAGENDDLGGLPDINQMFADATANDPPPSASPPPAAPAQVSAPAESSPAPAAAPSRQPTPREPLVTGAAQTREHAQPTAQPAGELPPPITPAAPITPATKRALKDALAEHGIPVADDATDEAILRDFDYMSRTAQEYEASRHLIDYARRLLPHRDRVEQLLAELAGGQPPQAGAGGQQPAPPQTQAQPAADPNDPWSRKPEFNPQWRTILARDARGRWTPAAGWENDPLALNYAQKANEHDQWSRQAGEYVVNNLPTYLKQQLAAFREEVLKEAGTVHQQQTQAQREDEEVAAMVGERQTDLFEHNPDGSPVLVYDQAGKVVKKPNVRGQRLQQIYNEEKRYVNLAIPGAKKYLAQKAIDREEYEWHLWQARQAAANPAPQSTASVATAPVTAVAQPPAAAPAAAAPPAAPPPSAAAVRKDFVERAAAAAAGATSDAHDHGGTRNGASGRKAGGRNGNRVMELDIDQMFHAEIAREAAGIN